MFAMYRHTVGMAIAAAMMLLSATSAFAHEAELNDLRVMTRNVYSGADLTLLFDALDPKSLHSAVGKVEQRVRATDFVERAKSLADEIAATRPHVIGLQEVALWRSQSPGDGPLSPAQTIEYDFLKLLRQELAARGQRYVVAARQQTFDIELFMIDEPNQQLRDVRFTDRDVVLVRKTHHLEMVNAQTGKFDEKFHISLPLIGDITYRRGWMALDMKLDGKPFRFINTHLEALSADVRDEQLQELLAGPANVNKRVVMAGDFNFAPNDPTTNAYDDVLSAGFADAWAEVRPAAAGNTCCQNPNLRNANSQLSARIDFVFYRGRLDAISVRRTGQKQTDRTPSGLWASDHAGVVTKLRFR